MNRRFQSVQTKVAVFRVWMVRVTAFLGGALVKSKRSDARFVEDRRVDVLDLGIDFEGRCLLNGEPYSGIVVGYYPDGQLKSEGYYNDGMIHGEWRCWYETGALKMYRSDKGMRYWTPAGRELSGDGSFAIEIYEDLLASGDVCRYERGAHHQIDPQILTLLDALRNVGFFE